MFLSSLLFLSLHLHKYADSCKHPRLYTCAASERHLGSNVDSGHVHVWTEIRFQNSRFQKLKIGHSSQGNMELSNLHAQVTTSAQWKPRVYARAVSFQGTSMRAMQRKADRCVRAAKHISLACMLRRVSARVQRGLPASVACPFAAASLLAHCSDHEASGQPPLNPRAAPAEFQQEPVKGILRKDCVVACRQIPFRDFNFVLIGRLFLIGGVQSRNLASGIVVIPCAHRFLDSLCFYNICPIPFCLVGYRQLPFGPRTTSKAGTGKSGERERERDRKSVV